MGTQKGLIFGSCACASWDFLVPYRSWPDVVIAADGGVRCAYDAGFSPDVYVGDNDSGGRARPGMEIVALQPEKDLTDLQAAYEWARDHGITELVLTACTGGRQDHHLAAMQLLETARHQGIRGEILDPGNRILFLENETVTVEQNGYHYFSLIPVDRVVHGVSIRGAKYPLEGRNACRGDSLTVSNEWLDPVVEITIGQGACYLILSN